MEPNDKRDFDKQRLKDQTRTDERKFAETAS